MTMQKRMTQESIHNSYIDFATLATRSQNDIPSVVFTFPKRNSMYMITVVWGYICCNARLLVVGCYKSDIVVTMIAAAAI